MRDLPKTKADAVTRRYGRWAGMPSGRAFDPSRCAAEIIPTGRGALPTQCGNKPTCGPDGLYCKRHGLEVAPPAAYPAWEVKSKFGHGISEIKIVDESDKFVTLSNGRKTSKNTEYCRIFTNLESAQSYARMRAESEIASAEVRIAEAKQFLSNLQ